MGYRKRRVVPFPLVPSGILSTSLPTDEWNSPLATVTGGKNGRQEIIKRYPEWRKNYRRISGGPRGVVVDGEGGGRTSDISITVRHTSPRVAGARANWRSPLGNNALLRNIVAQ